MGIGPTDRFSIKNSDSNRINPPHKVGIPVPRCGSCGCFCHRLVVAASTCRISSVLAPSITSLYSIQLQTTCRATSRAFPGPDLHRERRRAVSRVWTQARRPIAAPAVRWTCSWSEVSERLVSGDAGSSAVNTVALIRLRGVGDH